MVKDKPSCAYCGRIIDGSNFLGYCSQSCWKNAQKPSSKRTNNRQSASKDRVKAYLDEEKIIIEDTQKDAAHSLILQKLEELAVAGITSVVVVHPEAIKEDIRSPEFRKQIGSLGLKFKMEPSSTDTETIITHISF
jgi:hypothetical protein